MPEKEITNQNGFKNRISFFARKLKYEFQYYLSKGVKIQIIFLTIITVVTSFIFGLILIILNAKANDGKALNIFEAMWQSFLHTIDTGAIQAETDFTFRTVALFITLIGVFIFSALISVLTTGLDKYFVELRKGKTEIIDKDFTLILGWSPTIFKILEEKVLANANHKGNHIVILANIDKIKMEDEIASKVKQHELFEKVYHLRDKELGKKRRYYSTQIICRTGDPIDLDDLKIVNPKNAKSILILPTDNHLSDSYVIKCALALDGLDVSQKVISEIKFSSNRKAIKKSLEHKLKNKIFIPANEWLSKITAQTSRQSGYSIVLTEILNYENNEIYFKKVQDNEEDIINFNNKITGKSFEELYFASENAIIIGITKLNLDLSGLKVNPENIRNKIIINPFLKTIKDSKNRLIEKGDFIITIQYDDDPIVFDFKRKPTSKIYDDKSQTIQNKEIQNILIIGWNTRIETVIMELYDYISIKSEIIIVKEKKNKEKEEDLLNNIKDFLNLKNTISEMEELIPQIKFFDEDTTDYDKLEKYFNINSSNYPEVKFGEKLFSVIVLGYDYISNIQERDAKTILTLLHLHHLKQIYCINHDLNIVAEIYDEKNRSIVEVSDTCDYIISENIISSMMTQLSEQEQILDVFEEIFDSDGCEIYLKSVTRYFKDEFANNVNLKTSFYDIMCKASEYNEIAIGYREVSKNKKADNYGTIVNPINKNAEINLSKEDKIIVLSSNDSTI